MTVHLSIHDVSPAWSQEVEDALAACHAVGGRPALLVVPDFHGQWPLPRYPEFCKRLRALQQDGHEVYLHGYYHLAGPGGGEGEARRGDGRALGLRRFYAQRVVSGGEAEFSDVSRAEAERRLEEGEKVLAEAGLRIDGFIAPAWSMPRWLMPLLAARGYRYTEDHMRVYDPAGRRRRASLVLNFASRTPARLWSSVALCRAAGPTRGLVPTRVAIHPGDMRHPVLRREVTRILTWASKDRLTSHGRALLD